jgi:hypothetical protein
LAQEGANNGFARARGRSYVELKLEVQAQRRHKHGAAVAVVTGIIDMLQPKRWIDSAPCVERVKRFNDIFSAVVQTAIPQ